MTERPRKDGCARPKPGPRSQARDLALRYLYACDLMGADVESFDDFVAHQEMKGAAVAFARDLVEGTLPLRGRLDALLSGFARNWRLERMAVVDRNVLRLGAFELTRLEEVPAGVTIDEMVELAKRYGSNQSGSFVNGLLERVRRWQEDAGPEAELPQETPRRVPSRPTSSDAPSPLRRHAARETGAEPPRPERRGPNPRGERRGPPPGERRGPPRGDREDSRGRPPRGDREDSRGRPPRGDREDSRGRPPRGDREDFRARPPRGDREDFRARPPRGDREDFRARPPRGDREDFRARPPRSDRRDARGRPPRGDRDEPGRGRPPRGEDRPESPWGRVPKRGPRHDEASHSRPDSADPEDRRPPEDPGDFWAPLSDAPTERPDPWARARERRAKDADPSREDGPDAERPEAEGPETKKGPESPDAED